MSSNIYNIPIVFVHYGNSFYLELAIKQSLQFYKKEEVILLGDKDNKYLSQYCTHKVSNYKSSFKNIYKHYSTNGFDFEFVCFDRWFHLLELMKQNDLKWICYMDSDFMIYQNFS